MISRTLVPALSLLLFACGPKNGPGPEDPENWEEMPSAEPSGDTMSSAGEEEVVEAPEPDVEETEMEDPGEPSTEEGPAEDVHPATEDEGADLTSADGAHVEEGSSVEGEDDVDPPPEAPEPLQGKILSRKGKNIVVALDGEAPEPGGKGTLLKYFEQTIFGMKATGWLDIASVEVAKVQGSKVHLTIIEEHSETVMNGKKVNHFKKGNLVKIELL